MATIRMHEDEFEIDHTLVERLVASQFPRWAYLPLRAIETASTVNAIYRLGDDMAVRLPLRPGQEGQFEKDRRWLPVLAPHLPLAIPEPLAAGGPTEGYPSAWAVYRWLPGAPASLSPPADAAEAARQLAAFILALQAIDATDGVRPGSENYGRGAPLAPRDARFRRDLEALEGRVDSARAARVWDAALAAPEWDGPPVWLHGDLMPGNLLVHEGRLSAVIDFGALGVGDPASDLIPAWATVSGARDEFRTALGASVDDAMWARGRGWALLVAVMGLPYYRDTNPGFVAILEPMLEAVLADPDI